ncbi:MAG: type II glyceraldehyde-3-phosphate dehydrogenase [Methanospirillum sp.]
MIQVAVNGYGTIGKRVADAAAAQEDMEVVGVSKTHPTPEAFVAAERGYPLYIADLSKRQAFERAGLGVAGRVEEMLGKADVVVDATPAGIGAKNKPLYEKAGVKAIFEGGEEHGVAGFSFNAISNYRDAIGRQYIWVVSCNTTALCRIISAIDREYGIENVHAVLVRRSSDPGEIKKGPVDAIVLHPVTIPSHHGLDVRTVLPQISITTMAMMVPSTFMHMHAVQMRLRKEASKDGILKVIEEAPHMRLVEGRTGISSTAELMRDLERPRADRWKNGIFEDSIAAKGSGLCFFQAVHQEANVVLETIDAIRAANGAVQDPMRSIAMTDSAVGLTPRG